MEEFFRIFAGYAAPGLKIILALFITIGAVEGTVGLIRLTSREASRPLLIQKEVWLCLGVWMLIGLELGFGADIIRSAVTPTREQLGQFAGIAVIRTFFSYLLGKDIAKIAVTQAAASKIKA